MYDEINLQPDVVRDLRPSTVGLPAPAGIIMIEDSLTNNTHSTNARMIG